MSKKLDKYHYHEALDRSYCVTDIIQSMLLDHALLNAKKHKKWKKKVLKAQMLICEVYQDIGEKHL
jgi:hypothetical protein